MVVNLKFAVVCLFAHEAPTVADAILAQRLCARRLLRSSDVRRSRVRVSRNLSSRFRVRVRVQIEKPTVREATVAWAEKANANIICLSPRCVWFLA
uniref:Putative secreted protein n=1 Tax=Anopheles marajoara TaxID=58244 RepID=A0A2M4C991_9DIPT